MIIGKDTGELLGDAHAAFFEMQAVDQGQFVKIYLAGIKNTAKLTKAGMQVFEIVYNQMRENPQTDKIELNVYLAKKFGVDLGERTYQRGLRELLENEFLYRSPSADVFFVNIMYMFNGNPSSKPSGFSGPRFRCCAEPMPVSAPMPGLIPKSRPISAGMASAWRLTFIQRPPCPGAPKRRNSSKKPFLPLN